MARPRQRRPDLARRNPTKSLGYTAQSGFRAVPLSKPQYAPLMRTVLGDTVTTRPASIHRGRMFSPSLPVRASGRVQGRDKLVSLEYPLGQVPVEMPRRAVECAKRQIRREVLFATDRTSRGSRSPRRPKSNWRC